jgi:hypothetical protein
MKFVLLAYFLLLLSPLAIAQKFEVKLKQSGEDVKVENEIALLQKGNFEIELIFDNKIGGIYVNAAYEDLFYLSDNSLPVPELKNYLGYKVAEYPFNFDRKLYVDIETVHYMGPEFEYKGNKMHNFNTLEKKGKLFYGLREVSKINDRSNEFEVKDIKKPIYLYIVALKKSKDKYTSLDNLKDENVLFRKKYKIDWKQ